MNRNSVWRRQQWAKRQLATDRQSMRLQWGGYLEALKEFSAMDWSNEKDLVLRIEKRGYDLAESRIAERRRMTVKKYRIREQWREGFLNAVRWILDELNYYGTGRGMGAMSNHHRQKYRVFEWMQS